MTRPNRLLTTWPDPFWVILMVIGGWLATTAPVGPLLMALGLFMAVFCAQCLSRRQSEWEGYRRGFRAGWTRARSGSARACSGRPTTTALVIAVACGFGAAASVREQDASVAGIWRYNEEMSTPRPQAAADGQGRAPREGAPPGGSRGGMRGGGMPPGMPGLGRSPSPEDMRRRRVVVSRLTEPPASLVIVRDDARVIVTDGGGRSVTYTADGRKEPRLTGDGEFTSRATFEGQVLVIEEDFGGGVTLTTRLAPTSVDGRERLEVSLKGNGLPKPPDRGGRPVEPGGRPGSPPLAEVLRVYERAEP